MLIITKDNLYNMISWNNIQMSLYLINKVQYC